MRTALLHYIKADFPRVAAFQRLCGVDTETGTRGYFPLHLIFTLGASLGNEMFYILFLPFLFWAGAPLPARHVMVLWGVSGYVGQLAKDMLCLPRPGPPAVRLEAHYAAEYGLPSTHAMFAFSIPLCLAVYLSLPSSDHIPLSPPLLWSIAAVWASAKTLSRLYLGVHSHPDIVAGIALGLFFTLLLVASPIGDMVDAFIVSRAAPSLSSVVPTAMDSFGLTHPGLAIMAFSSAALFAVPIINRGAPWTSTFADTATIAGACNGALIASSLYDASVSDAPAAMAIPPTIAASFPNLSLAPIVLARLVVGFVVLALVRLLSKAVWVPIFATLANTLSLPSTPGSPSRNASYCIDIPARLLTYSCVGFAAVGVVPFIFDFLAPSAPSTA